MHLHYFLAEYESSDGEIKYRVDCEYNKQGKDKKQAPQEYYNESMRPDIIIHHRALNGECFKMHNLLFCEMKINGLSGGDIIKIRGAINEYNYMLGVGIYNLKEDSVCLTWYEKIEDEISESKISYEWDKVVCKLKVKA